MCGLVAALGPHAKEGALRAHRDLLLSKILHRGPDGHRIWSSEDGNAHFGHARLSVIDLESGWQPLSDKASGTTIVFNGEIYNFKKLREELKLYGHSFQTLSDTEVLLKSYIQWEEKCLPKLEGIFSFCIYDSRKKSLFFARDPFGVKPLFFQKNEDTLNICSELRPLAIFSSCAPTLNPSAAIQYLTMGYSMAPETMLQGIEQLQAGEFGIWRSGSLKREIYFALEKNITSFKKRKSAELQDEFKHLFTNAVRSQLVSDIPIGIALSGGIDSSLLSAVTSEITNRPVDCFTVDFSLQEYSELSDARQVASLLGANHHVSTIALDLSVESVKSAAWKSDSPIFDNSFLPTSQLFEKVKPQMSVLLSGDGGDELFLGYETYKADLMAQKLSRLPEVSLKGMNFIGSFIKAKQGKVTQTYKAKRFLAELRTDLVASHFGWRNLLDPVSLGEIRSTEKCDLWEEYDSQMRFSKMYPAIPSEVGHLTKLSILDIKTWMTNDILVKLDRASMASGVEARVPFLDLSLAKFALSLSDEEKFSLKETKKPLRNELKRMLPQYIPGTKKGFVFPAGEWIQKTMEINGGFLSTLDNPLLEFLDRSVLQRFCDQHLKGNANYTHFIWSLVTFNYWWGALQEERSRSQSS